MAAPGRRVQTLGNLGESIFDSDTVPPSLVEIAPILRVANEIEEENPRSAYLCRFYAFEKAHRLDPTSSGPGVRQFKTALLQTLAAEDDPRVHHQRDAREMASFYFHYVSKYIRARQNSADKADRALLSEAYQTAAVLIEVCKAVNVWPSAEDLSSSTTFNVLPHLAEISKVENVWPSVEDLSSDFGYKQWLIAAHGLICCEEKHCDKTGHSVRFLAMPRKEKGDQASWDAWTKNI